jgi:addiction module RelE/StbE family toxin
LKVYWTRRAKRHLQAIYDYIAEDSLSAAKEVADKITSRSKQIASFPLSGRKVPHLNRENIRELIEGNYRIVYHLIEDRADVIAVIHSARNTLLG